jgi:hypothetical protein
METFIITQPAAWGGADCSIANGTIR